MKITIHRGAHEIGGTCIRLSTEQSSILLDLGLPLSKNSKEIDVAALKPNAVLISHPHQDHFGLIEALKPDVPVYMGELSKNLINATRMLLGNDLLKNEIHYFKAWQPFVIGDFTITPYLMDHSAVDAYGFLIESEGKRLFYSGDFRAHGRKSILFDKIIKNPPKDIDLLFMEGTMIQRENDDFPTEADVEQKIYETIKEQENITFLISSSQNIDRIVSAFRACLRAGKILVLDIYTAWILEKLKLVSPNIPAMEWDQIKIKLSYSQHEKLKDNPEFFGDFRKRVYQHRITKEEMQANPSDYLYFGKMSHFRTINFYKEIKPVNIIYSQWLGYLSYKDEDYFGAEAMAGYRNDPQVNFVYAHTSGHATVEDLQKFAAALKPKMLVPVHTEHGNQFNNLFRHVEILEDGVEFILSMGGKMRGLKPEFIAALQDGGVLHPILNRIKKDKTLDFQIRSNEVHIYYRGGKILGIKPGVYNYICKFDANYNKHKEIELPEFSKKISSESDSKTIVAAFPQMKQAMDIYFADHKDASEREFQQLISRENNYSILSNATDYFIVDIEYETEVNGKKARFDLLAIKWESDGNHRKNPKKFLPKLAICELKYYTQALSGKAGLIDHVKDVSGFIANPDNVEQLKADVREMFKQKRELGLVDFGSEGNNNPVEHLDNSIELILMLANHDPESTKLKNLEEIPEENGLDIKVAVANFLGYGLYKESVYDLSDFKEKFKRQIYCKLTDIDKARQLFQKAGFDLPAIPDLLAKRIKQREEMLFSTRVIPMSPNFSSFYVDEVSNNTVGDYVLISYSRNGANWMAIHYYLVFGPLRMFLELGRGGMYSDDEGDAIQVAKIRECFLLADKIVPATMAMCKANDRLTIFCSDFHGSYWVVPSQDAQKIERRCHCPKDVLSEVLQWLGSSEGDGMNFMEYVLKLAEEMDGKEKEEFLSMAEQIDREEDEFEQRKILYLSDYRKRLGKK